MRRVLFLAKVAIFAFLMQSSVGRALEPFEIPATGELYELSLSSVVSPQSPVVVYFVSPGSVSLAAGLIVEGPPGLRGVVESGYLPEGASTYAESLASATSFEPSPLKNVPNAGARETNEFIIDPESRGGSIQLLYHIHKNACLPDKKSRYVSRITFWFTQVPTEYLTDGATLRVGVKEFPYPGSEVASIKPASDGKYRGEPILLMGTIQYGGEYVNVIQRGANRVRSRRRLPVVKYVYHRGHTLSLARLRGILNGGQATFELSNGGYIYGVCFQLARRRQVANNYPLS